MKSRSRSFRLIFIIVLLSLTAAMTLLGGAGTSCVAFNAEKFGPRMAVLIPVKPIFQVLVVVSLAAGVYGVYSIVRLARRRPGAFRQCLVFLVIGLAASAVQYYYSLTLRGSTAPNNMRLYLTAFTLAVMLLLRLTGWDERKITGGAGGDANRPASGAALFLTGLVVLTTPLWVAPTHVIAGENTVNVLLWPLLISGAVLTTWGGLKLRPRREKLRREVEQTARQAE